MMGFTLWLFLERFSVGVSFRNNCLCRRHICQTSFPTHPATLQRVGRKCLWCVGREPTMVQTFIGVGTDDFHTVVSIVPNCIGQCVEYPCCKLDAQYALKWLLLGVVDFFAYSQWFMLASHLSIRFCITWNRSFKIAWGILTIQRTRRCNLKV